ncbi:MAG: glycerol dehydrogenase [Pseudomonadales bacterium]|nr:glycerol dehydrogenase [Pseudomonadales bacterium]
MSTAENYVPYPVFSPPGTGSSQPPRVFIGPQRYVQGEGVLDGIGRYLSLLSPRRAAVMISERGRTADGRRVFASLEAASIEPVVSVFQGECSLEEIARHVESLQGQAVDCLLAVGGGKCVDAGKAVAHRLQIPVVIVPTLASNDAPTSAVSVLYTTAGVSSGAEFYPNNPALVVVDTGIVARAPVRFLVAGMGDAMATWYEARACLKNPKALNVVGARPTLAAAAIGGICADTLFKEGTAAIAAVAAGRVDESLEKVVEANTLLSGLGFESGGLAGAHGIAQSYTAIPSVHAGYLHGEMVAMGTLTQLMMEGERDEACRVAEFFAAIGLPVHLGHMGLCPDDESALAVLVKGGLEFPFIRNLGVRVDAELIRSAILDAHALGLEVTGRLGDRAFRALHEK